MKTIKISVDDISMAAEVYDTPTGQVIMETLPFESAAHVWGDEIYFEIPVSADLEPDARETVAVGDLGYWPVGSALCIFFGPTPVSDGEAPRAYSPVNVFGRVVGDARAFKKVAAGSMVRVVLS
jgi:uncharacterized protein